MKSKKSSNRDDNVGPEQPNDLPKTVLGST